MTEVDRAGTTDGPATIDWDLALATARRLARPAPVMSADEIAEVVADLREGAAAAEEPVRSYTGLTARSGTAPVLVVDRVGWVKANLEGFEQLLTPLLDRAAQQRPGGRGRSVGAKVSGAELGAVMGYLSSRVLGQFDPFSPVTPGAADDAVGRMLLVAPNVVAVGRDLGVDAHDFRRWVCLHEETHRVQFTAVPWMRDHLQGLISTFTAETPVDPEGVQAVLGRLTAGVGRAVRGEPVSLAELMATPGQQQAIDALTGVMSLLEGHADVVMDGVGPQVVPSVRRIRRAFDRRRAGGHGLDALVRRLLGLDRKMAQYRDGAVFVRTVVDRVGHEGFNAVWTSPAQLPTKAEIEEPAAWVRRVHG